MPPRRNVRNGNWGPTPQTTVDESVAQTIPQPTPPPPVDREIVKLFLKQKPPVFDGMGEPEKAETWIRALERIFTVLMCNDEERMTCVTYQLTGSADFWWDTKMKTKPRDQVGRMTWENFKEEKYNKYVPKSYQKAKTAEFYNLTQGRMSVTEYDRALCDMTRYAPEQVDTDEKLADKFREGLRHEIKMTLASRGRLTYAEALALALDVEAAMPKERVTENTTLALPPPHHSREKRKWDENRTTMKTIGTSPPKTDHSMRADKISLTRGVTSDPNHHNAMCAPSTISDSVECRTLPSALTVEEMAISLESVRARMWGWGQDRTIKDSVSIRGHHRRNQG